MAEYSFRALIPADKPLFMNWLAEPHIGGWWKDPDAQWTHVEAHWSDDLNRTLMQIVQLGGADFAYVQTYNAHAYDTAHYADRPRMAQAMDCFLGDPAFLAKGHGSGFIRARARQLVDAGAPSVVVDPDVLNTHAIGSYERAGFERIEERRVDGEPPILLMEFKG